MCVCVCVCARARVELYGRASIRLHGLAEAASLLFMSESDILLTR